MKTITFFDGILEIDGEKVESLSLGEKYDVTYIKDEERGIIVSNSIIDDELGNFHVDALAKKNFKIKLTLEILDLNDGNEKNKDDIKERIDSHFRYDLIWLKNYRLNRDSRLS